MFLSCLKVHLELRINEEIDSPEELIRNAKQLQSEIASRYELDQIYSPENFDKHRRAKYGIDINDQPLLLEGGYIEDAQIEAKKINSFA